MNKKFESDIQIRFADIDGLGHVNNVNLQHYFDLGKMEFYTAVMGQKVEPTDESLILVSTQTEYFFQTRLYDKVYVETAVEKIGTKSITFTQRLIDRRTGCINAQCRTVSVPFDFVKQQSFEVKPQWRERLQDYLISL